MKFSVITISYNQGAFIRETIESVLNQRGDFTLEYIVIDGGSTDRSVDIIREYADRLHYWESSPDRGPADALNKGFALATGDYYYYLNSDDLILPDALSKVAKFITNNLNYDVYYGHGYIFDSIKQKYTAVYSDRWHPIGYAQGRVSVLQQSTFIRASAYKLSPGFNVDNRRNWDGELLADLSLTGATFIRFPFSYKIGLFRIHDASITGSQNHLEKYHLEKIRIGEKLATNFTEISYGKFSKLFSDPGLVLRRLLSKLTKSKTIS